jgi:hypothetical protein
MGGGGGTAPTSTNSNLPLLFFLLTTFWFENMVFIDDCSKEKRWLSFKTPCVKCTKWGLLC